MENEFLANIQIEGEKIDAPSESEREEKETPAASPAENKQDEQEPASPAEEKKDEAPEESEKEEPAVYHAFHEHPRWIAREQELKELQEKNNELTAFQERVEPLLKKLESPVEKNETIPEEFSGLFGNDENAWKLYQQLNKRQQDEIIRQTEEKFKPLIEEAQKTRQQKEMDSWADKEWNSLKADVEVQAELKKLSLSLTKEVQAEISNVIAKYLPTDEKTGNISVRKGYEIWKDTRTTHEKAQPNPVTEEKKKIADTTMKKSPVSETTKDFKTMADFKGKSIQDLY